MSFRILCPVCQAAFAIADRYRGKVIRCRKCQCALRVPGKVADDDEKDSEGDLPRTAWPKKRPRKKVALKSASATETKTATHDSRRVLFGNRLPYILGAFALVATIAVVWWPPEVQQSRQQKKLGENEFELDSLPLAVAATHKTLQPLLKRNNFTQMSIVVDNNDERAIVISLFERFKAGKFKAPSLKNLKSMYTHDTPQVHIMRVEDNQAIPKVRHLKLNEEPDSNTFYLVSNVSGKFG